MVKILLSLARTAPLPTLCTDLPIVDVMQCGPAPVKAVRNGDVYLGYDTKFIFAEVNGDRLTWVVTDEDIVPTNVDR